MYNKSASWANSSVLFQLQHLADLSFYYLFKSSETNKIIGGQSLILFKKKNTISNLFSGPIINDIMENIQSFMSNKSNGLKAKVYSGVIEIYFSLF